MKLNRPLRFETATPPRLESRCISDQLRRTQYLPPPVTPSSASVTDFKRLLAQYKRAGFEWSQIWLQTHQQNLFTPKPIAPMVVRTIIEPFEYPEWVVEGWTIKFLLSERLLTHARKQATLSNWYEDPQIVDTWEAIITTCFHSIIQYHQSFHILPVIGDRLFDEDTGWRIQDRSINGQMRTVTFTMDS